MALKPLLKRKIDELFLRWLSEQETQHVLKTNLQQVLRGETVTNPAPINYGSKIHPQSPRIRPGSPATPPCSPTPSKITSPRSPRRPSVNKALVRQLNNKAPKEDTSLREKDLNAKYGVANNHRGVPDGEADTFLKQKEAQLREKRERENREKNKDHTDNVPNSKKGSLSEAKLTLNKKKDAGDSAPNGGVTVVPISDKPSPGQNSLPLQGQGEGKGQGQGKSLQLQSQARPRSQTEHIPQFYFPLGRPGKAEELEAEAQRIKDAFSKVEGGKATKQHMVSIARACGLSLYWKQTLFCAAGGEKNGYVTLQAFLALWRKVSTTCHCDEAKFVRMLAKPGCNYLTAEDFVPLIQDVVDTHPGLTFLQDAPEFHSRYVHTVIARIFYTVNRSWTGKITVGELRRCNLLQTLVLVEEEEDINAVSDFFSYEHFYVIYCKFWELDKDHDLFISREDLARHNEHAISSRMIERIFSGAVTRGRAQKEGKMSYTEFVWFLISEEDKKHPTSIEYWFRCMDMDGDGVISMYEMEYFYEEQVKKMEALGIETLPFEDCLCQMLDMVKPKQEGKITLSDLKNCKMTPIFFDTFFNLEKYLDHEQKDPFANDPDEPEMTDWERYAAEEYEILVAEEGANDAATDELVYEDDFEGDDEEMPTLPSDSALHLSDPPQRKVRPKSSPEDDIYDFNTKDLGY